MPNLRLGPYKRFLLLGGGPLVLELARWAKGRGLAATVLTSPRHAAEPSAEKGPSFADAASKAGLDCRVLEKIDDKRAREAIGDMEGTFALSHSAPWIFKKEVIEGVFEDRLFNIHGTRLPQNRGGGGFSWQILMGNRLGFCVMHRIDPGVDTGEIVAMREFIYPPAARTPADFLAHHRQENFRFLTELLGPTKDGAVELKTVSQPEHLSTYFPRINSVEQGWIDWSLPADALDRFVCAFDDPFCGAQTYWNETRVFLKKSLVDRNDPSFHPFQAGIVYRNNGRWLCVAADGGSLLVQEVVDEQGQSVLPKIQVGDRLFTPQRKLAAKRNRPIYTAVGLKKR